MVDDQKTRYVSKTFDDEVVSILEEVEPGEEAEEVEDIDGWRHGPGH
jgi:hypothetical protein